MDFRNISTIILIVVAVLGGIFLFQLFGDDKKEVNYTNFKNFEGDLKNGQIKNSKDNSNSASIGENLNQDKSGGSVLSQAPPIKNESNFKELRGRFLKKGDGAEAKNGDQVTIHYIGRFEDGSIFDSSLKRGKPLSFDIGTKKIIQGLQSGLIGMKQGGARRLFIPSKHAYGKQGKGDAIPPNANLIFDVELLKVKKSQQTQQGMMQQMQP